MLERAAALDETTGERVGLCSPSPDPAIHPIWGRAEARSGPTRPGRVEMTAGIFLKDRADVAAVLRTPSCKVPSAMGFNSATPACV